MNKTFLGAVAAQAAATDISRTLFIFPNRRAATFFHRALTADGQPRTIHTGTLDDLMAMTAGARPLSRIAALTMLHACWKRVSGEDTPLDAFLVWGDTLLADLDEIAAADIDLGSLPPTLDGYLSSLGTAPAQRFLGSLPFTEDSPQKSLRDLYPKLAPLQAAFHKALSEQGLATPGMMQQMAAMKARNTFAVPAGQYARVALVGLGRLTPCQKAVLQRLHADGRAAFYWDWAGRAVTDPSGGGATFMTENLAAFPQAPGFECPAAEMASQRWAVVHVPSASGQAEVVAQAIDEALASGTKEDDIAVVLADGSLLRPVLDAIPDTVQRINVTMGQSIAESAAATLAGALAEMARTARRDKDMKPLFYYKAVTAVLRHPYIRTAAAKAAEAEASILAAGRPWVDPAQLTLGDAVLETVLCGTCGNGSFADRVLATLAAVQKDAPAMEREYIAAYHAMTRDLKAAVGEADLSSAAWLRLLRRGAALTAIPFEGEPLQGLQVLGVLETRCLDFDTVIYAGAAEGLLPAPGSRASLLPQALRQILGLPGAATREATAEYNFWRSTCRAGSVTLIHDNRTDGMRCGEETRYAKQLRHLYGITPEDVTVEVTIDASALETPLPSLEKDAGVLRALEEKFVTGTGAFSATSINAYLECPMRWWWAHVRGVKTDEDIVENPDAAILGTIYHSVMENLYKPFVGKTLQAADYAALSDEVAVAALADAAFAENGIPEPEGRNAILRDVVVRMARQTLETDRAQAPLTILGTESSASLRLQLPRSGKTVRLYGKIDRMDRTAEGCRRVVDYKSGTVKGHDDTRDALRTLDRTLGTKRPRIGLQLLLYALLTEDAADPAKPCIYSTREIFGAVPKAASVAPEALAAFRDALAETLDEIFDPATPITATPDEDRCKNCPFKTICNRS